MLLVFTVFLYQRIMKAGSRNVALFFSFSLIFCHLFTSFCLKLHLCTQPIIFPVLRVGWNMSFVCLNKLHHSSLFFSFYLATTEKALPGYSHFLLENQWIEVSGIYQSTQVFLVNYSHNLRSISRNCGPARSGCVWPGVQPVEKQGVCVSQLQQKHRRLALCTAPGEMSGNGTQQQPYRQPQVKPLSPLHNILNCDSHSRRFITSCSLQAK